MNRKSIKIHFLWFVSWNRNEFDTRTSQRVQNIFCFITQFCNYNYYKDVTKSFSTITLSITTRYVSTCINILFACTLIVRSWDLRHCDGWRMVSYFVIGLGSRPRDEWKQKPTHHIIVYGFNDKRMILALNAHICPCAHKSLHITLTFLAIHDWPATLSVSK
jgi:hypothetical protein